MFGWGSVLVAFGFRASWGHEGLGLGGCSRFKNSMRSLRRKGYDMKLCVECSKSCELGVLPSFVSLLVT